MIARANSVTEVLDIYSDLRAEREKYGNRNRAILKRDGKEFASAVVDIVDGYVRTAYSFEQVSEHGFHHNGYLEYDDYLAFDECKAVIVWFGIGGGLTFDLRNINLEREELADLRARIYEQIIVKT